MTELRTINLTHDGAALEGQLAVPEGPGPHPGVLVMSNAMGLGVQAREVAGRLAALGYVALATDMYGGGVHYGSMANVGPPVKQLFGDPALLRSRVAAWHNLLKTLPQVDAARTAAIGYCFGGQCVLDLARSGADARAVVSFHGVLKTTMPAVAGKVKAHVAVYTGSIDPYAPRADVEALRAELEAAGAKWQITEFGDVLHSFTDPNAAEIGAPGIGYDPLAHQLSWVGTVALLEAMLKNG